MMANSELMTCDGCGQLADAEHVARRFRRLEWATRHRPVHIQTLILGGVAPTRDAEYLYAPESAYEGHVGDILRAAGITAEGKTHEAVVTEFQKLGLMLAYMLECPLNDGVGVGEAQKHLEHQLHSVFARIRRSMRPRRIVLFSAELSGLEQRLRQEDLGCPILPASGGALFADPAEGERDSATLREALGMQ